MKKVLLVSQSQDGSFINILYSALKNADCELHVITGIKKIIKNMTLEDGEFYE